VKVDLIGTLIRLCGCMYYLCPCCTGIRIWMGDGSDFDYKECPCWRFGGGRSAVISEFNSQVSHATGLSRTSSYLCRFPGSRDAAAVSCLVCGAKSIFARARMILPQAECRTMRRVNFCRRHCPPEHMLHNITGFEEVQTVLCHISACKGRR
jgi:hypothetical protein